MSETESKNKPASKRKLQKKRSEGIVAGTQELSSLFAMAITLIYLLLAGGIVWIALVNFLEGSSRLILLPFDSAIKVGAEEGIRIFVYAISPVIGTAIVVSLLVTIVTNGGILFSTRPVQPDMQRVSPVSGFRRIFGKRGWIETGMAFARSGLWLILVAVISSTAILTLLKNHECHLECQVEFILPLISRLLIVATVLAVIFALADVFIQRGLFLGEQRMTESELKRERKEQSGAPEVRKERRRIMRESADAAEHVGASKANMCFYFGDAAIAVRYRPPDTVLPRIVARASGADAANKLRQEIRANGFPECEMRSIAERSVRSPLGSTLDRALFEDFAKGLAIMFKGAPE